MNFHLKTPRTVYTDYSPAGPWTDGQHVTRNSDGVGFIYSASTNALNINPNVSASIKDANGFTIINVPLPRSGTSYGGDVVNRDYVDSHSGGGPGGGIPDAPSDGTIYGRINAAWNRVVALSGGTMTGPLILSGNPTNALGAVTKQYSDTKLSDAPSDGSLYGRLNAAWAKALPLSGGTLTGALTLSGDPGTAMQAATKQYVDAHTGSGLTDAPSDGSTYGRLNAAWSKVLPLAGGTLTGPLILNADPTTALGAATKQYVDAHAGTGGGGVIISDTAPSSPAVGALWWDSTAALLYIWYNDGTSSQWVNANNLPASGIIGPQGPAGPTGPAGPQGPPGTTTFAPPTASLGLTAITGTATTSMSSDSAPALSQAITPTWTGLHAFSAGLTAGNLADIAGTVRSTQITTPTSGTGLEIVYNAGSGIGGIAVYDRTNSVYKPLLISGSTITLNQGPVSISNANASTSSTTGALTVAGGLGVGGTISLANNNSLNTMDSSGANNIGILRLDGSNPDILHLRNNQRGVGGAISLESKAGGGAALTCLANGNVGIGDTNPGFSLVVNNGGTNQPSHVKLTNGTYSGFVGVGTGQDAIQVAGGAYYNGSTWIATSTAGATVVGFGASNFNLNQCPSGQTIGAGLTSFGLRASCSSTAGWQAQGTTTNDNASAGFIGEYVTASAAQGAIPLTTQTASVVTQIPLTAGDWDVWGVVSFSGTGTTTVSYASASTSTAPGLGGIPSRTDLFLNNGTPFAYITTVEAVVTPVRFLLNAAATAYLTAQAAFGASTMAAGGTIFARRRR